MFFQCHLEKKKRGMFSCSWWKPLQKKKVIKMSSFGTQSKRYIYKIAVIPKAQMTLQRTGQKDCKNRETRSLLQNSISLQCRMLHTVSHQPDFPNMSRTRTTIIDVPKQKEERSQDLNPLQNYLQVRNAVTEERVFFQEKAN